MDFLDALEYDESDRCADAPDAYRALVAYLTEHAPHDDQIIGSLEIDPDV